MAIYNKNQVQQANAQFQNQNQALQGGLAQKANQQYNQAQGAQAEYGRQIGAVTDPTAAARMRSGFEQSLGQTQGMVAGIAANPGYAPAEAGAIRTAATAPVAAAYGSAAGDVANHTARTNNAAGYAPAMAQLAHQRGMDVSQAGAGAEKGIADARIQGTQFATTASQFAPQQYGEAQNRETNNASLYSLPMTSNFSNFQNLTGQQTQAQNTQLQQLQQMQSLASQPGFLKQLALAGMGGAGQAGGAYGMKALG